MLKILKTGQIVIFLLSYLNVYAQNEKDCTLYNVLIKEHIAKEYYNIYIIDSVVGFDQMRVKENGDKIFDEITDKKYIQKELYKKSIKKGGKLNDDCVKTQKIGQKKDLRQIISKINFGDFIKDSSFVQFVDQKQLEINNIVNEEERMDKLNELTKTDEFRKYTKYLNYFRPRMIELSNPRYIKKYAFICVNISTNSSLEWINDIYIFEKYGTDGWKLLVKKVYNNFSM